MSSQTKELKKPTSASKQKHPGGRPTKYKPEYCQLIVELGKQGKTFAQIASQLDTHIDTMLEWKSKYPEFSEAYKRCRQEQLAVYEQLGVKMMLGRKDSTMPAPNAAIWIFTMKARFGYKEDPEPEFEDQEIDFV